MPPRIVFRRGSPPPAEARAPPTRRLSCSATVSPQSTSMCATRIPGCSCGSTRATPRPEHAADPSRPFALLWSSRRRPRGPAADEPSAVRSARALAASEQAGSPAWLRSVRSERRFSRQKFRCAPAIDHARNSHLALAQTVAASSGKAFLLLRVHDTFVIAQSRECISKPRVTTLQPSSSELSAIAAPGDVARSSTRNPPPRERRQCGTERRLAPRWTVEPVERIARFRPPDAIADGFAPTQ